MIPSIYFVTGTTGFLGGEYLRTALKADPTAQFYCLIRDTATQSATARMQQMLHSWDLSQHAHRVIAISGDMTADNLDLTEQQYQELTKKVTHILHAAALVKFEKPEAVLAQINIRGTENIIAFAQACKAENTEFKALGYVSTAYVAGKRIDLVLERDFSADSGFKNNYEATKFAAEAKLHAVKGSLPVMIFRPSIILGHSLDGTATRNNVIFPLVQVVKKCAANWVPFNKNCLLDLVPVDYVAKSIYFLLQNQNAQGQVFHLSCGAGKEVSIGQVLTLFNQIYQLNLRTIPIWFWPLGRPLLNLSKTGRYLTQRIDPYWLYTVVNPQFSCDYTQEMLQTSQLHCPKAVDTLEKTLSFMERNFF